MPRYWEDHRRRRFRALVEGFEKAHPEKPLPPLSHYSKMLSVDIRTLRDWAKVDFADIYMQTEGWPSIQEVGIAMAERSKNRVADPGSKIELPKSDADQIAKAAATFDDWYR